MFLERILTQNVGIQCKRPKTVQFSDTCIVTMAKVAYQGIGLHICQCDGFFYMLIINLNCVI